MRILLIRHAEPDYVIDSLTPAGHAEAQALAAHLARTGLDELYASPRGRARATAQYTAERLGAPGSPLPVTIEPWTAELDGLYDEQAHRSLWDTDGSILRAPQMLADLNHWPETAPMNHPRVADHLRRIRQSSDDFLSRQGFNREGSVYHFSEPNRKRIAIFAHLGFGLAWLALLLEIPLPLMWAGFYMHPSSVTTILMDERAPGLAVPRLIGLGDISHLAQAGLPPSNMGLIANTD